MILVTGGTGLVGSHLVQSLVKKGEKVRVLKQKTSNTDVYKTFLNDASINDKIEWAEGNVLDVFSLEDALAGVSKVYHTAAIVSFHHSDRAQMARINTEGTANVVNACLGAGVEKLCHVSSVAALGRANSTEHITEETEWKASPHNSDYAKTKYAAEREVWRGIAEGLNAVIVNPSVILGPSNWNTGSSALFSSVYKGLRYYPVGSNAFVDVRDVAQIMIELMDSPISGDRFIVMGENLSYKALFDKMAANLKVKGPSIKVSPAMAELAWRLFSLRSFFTGKTSTITRETARTSSQCYFYSNEKIKKAIDYKFRSIEESVAYTSEAFRRSLNIKTNI